MYLVCSTAYWVHNNNFASHLAGMFHHSSYVHILPLCTIAIQITILLAMKKYLQV